MFNPTNLLLLSLLLPIVGIGLIWALAPRGVRAVRQSALITSVFTLLIVAALVAQFPGGEGFYGSLDVPWLAGSADELGTPVSGIDVRFSIGLDGLSLWLYALSALLVVTAVLVSWEAITDRPAAFYAALLLLSTGMLGVFAARDIILFYIFFEFTLIPLFFLIGIWGSEDRRHAAVKFFVYTFAGSVLTFLGLLTIVLHSAQQTGVMTFSIAELTASVTQNPLPTAMQVWVFLALFVGFAIKVPLFPLHTWLPLAHVQAPTAGSVLLAGVLLKIGTYGFVRFNMAMLPEATVICMPYLLWLSVIGIIYGALVALAQSDIKRLIAYSSVSHLGFCMLGLFALNRLGMQGGTLQMINHGLSTGGLFACVGMIYERYHTRQIRDLGGMARTTPILALFMLVFTFSSIGLPGLNGFVGEFLVLLGMFQRSQSLVPTGYETQYLAIAVLATFGVVLGAWYMLWLVQRTFFGPVRVPAGHGLLAHEEQGGNNNHARVRDLSGREICALAPLVLFVVWIGLKPAWFLDSMSPTLNTITQVVESEYERQLNSEAPATAIAAGAPQRLEVGNP